MKLRIIILLALIGCGFGCTIREIATPDGKILYKSTRFGNKETIGSIEYVFPDGSKFVLKGFGSDQVSALGVVTEAAVRAAVSSAKP
jgi:hypothetical protein